MKFLRWLRRLLLAVRFSGDLVQSFANVHFAAMIPSLTSKERAELDSSISRLRSLLVPAGGGASFPTLRVGGPGDGGYLVGDCLAPDGGTVLSFGVGNEVRADRALARRGYRVFLFDPFVEKPPRMSRGMVFSPTGLGPRDEIRDDIAYRSLPSLVKDLLSPGDADALLFMDIEGGEWDVFDDLASLAPQFSQIVLELHNLDRLMDSTDRDELLGFLTSLNQGFTPIALNANLISPVLPMGSFLVPRTVEVSFVRSDALSRPARTDVVRDYRPNNQALGVIPPEFFGAPNNAVNRNRLVQVGVWRFFG